MPVPGANLYIFTSTTFSLGERMMHKEELIALHGILTEIKDFFELQNPDSEIFTILRIKDLTLLRCIRAKWNTSTLSSCLELNLQTP